MVEAKYQYPLTLTLLKMIAHSLSEATERVLQENKAQFRAIVEQAAIGIALVTTNGQFLQVNQKLCQILGYTASELLSLTCPDITHPDDVPTTRERMEQLKKGIIDSYSHEKRYLRKDQQWQWVKVTVSAVKNIQGVSESFIVIIEDIQEHKQTVEALQQREQEFKALVENCPDAILRVDRDLRYRYINPTVETFSGQPASAFIGKKVQELGHPDSVVSLWVDTVERVFETGEEQTIEYEFPSPEQMTYWWSRIVPERNAQGNVETILVISRHITDRKQAEKQLRYRLTLETALAFVSKELAVNEDADLNLVLQWLGIAVDASRAYLICFEQKVRLASMIHEWCDEVTLPHQQYFQNFDISVFPWWMAKIKNNQNVIINQVEALPEVAKAEKKHLKGIHVNSVIAVPIFTHNNELWGLIGFDSTGNKWKTWLDEDAQLLKIAGDMIYRYYERLETQKALKASQALYASIFEHSAEAICLVQVQADGRFVYETVNPAYAQATGIPAQTFIGKTPSEIFLPLMANIIENWFKTCVNVQKTLSYEEILELPIGERIWRTNLVPIVNEAGKVIKLQGSSRDITEEKKILKQKMRYTRHQQLLGAISLKIRQSWQITDIWQTAVSEIHKALQVERVLLLQLDSQQMGRIINEAVTPPFVSLLETAIKLPNDWEQWHDRYQNGYIDICPNVALASCHPFCWQVLKTYQIRAHIVVPVFQQQTEKTDLWGLLWIQQCSQPRQWAKEEIELLRQLSNQLTIALDQVYLRQQQIARTQELTRSNRELEQFSYIVSHDLQAPLGTISSYAKLLQNRYESQLDAKANNYLQRLISGTQRMRQQIDDLLKYSRVSTQKQLFEATDCNEIVKAVIANLQFVIEKNQAIIEIPTTLPTLMADSSQLLQLFQNLFGNALKYRTEQSPWIVVRACWQNEGWLFSIIDNGIGIDPKDSERIFQIFQRLHTSEEYPGTGIGLAICQRIIQRHGGSISVKSQLGKGSIFYFTIPHAQTSLDN